MKLRNTIIIAAGILALAGCKALEEIPLVDQQPVSGGNLRTWHVTLKATKSDVDNKALDLDGSTLNAYWTAEEKVAVYKGGQKVGTLNVYPDAGEKPTMATLSGDITGDLVLDEEISLLIPRDSWDYSNQGGTLESVGSDYDYATATVTVKSLEDDSVILSGATFDKEQSIYRFGFKESGSYIDLKDIIINSANGGLVSSRALNGSEWVSTPGAVSVVPASTPTDHLYYVSIRNESTEADTYQFRMTGSNDALYLSSKAIPASVLDAPGKFIGAKNTAASKPDFSPASGSVSSSENVY